MCGYLKEQGEWRLWSLTFLQRAKACFCINKARCWLIRFLRGPYSHVWGGLSKYQQRKWGIWLAPRRLITAVWVCKRRLERGFFPFSSPKISASLYQNSWEEAHCGPFVSNPCIKISFLFVSLVKHLFGQKKKSFTLNKMTQEEKRAGGVEVLARRQDVLLTDFSW